MNSLARALALLIALAAVEAGAAEVPPVSFRHDVIPILTKTGCNGGGCHGKMDGQNGFKLSLLGFEPAEDYEHLVIESRGRRLMPSSPEFSLLLRKATGELPHGGGARLERGSPEYQMLVRWMEEGAPGPRADEPRVTRIEVAPHEAVLTRGAEQQLAVTAQLSDGSSRDITKLACFETVARDMAEVDSAGRVRLGQLPGDAAIMVRFQDQLEVFRATIPLGPPLAELPPARNFIDTLVFEKLRTLGLPPSAPCDDPTFLRRVTLDLAGRLPTADEAGRLSPRRRGRQARSRDRPPARQRRLRGLLSPTNGRRSCATNGRSPQPRAGRRPSTDGSAKTYAAASRTPNGCARF